MSADRPSSGFPELQSAMPDLQFPPHTGGPGPNHPPVSWGLQPMMSGMPSSNSAMSPFSPPNNMMAGPGGHGPSPFDDPHMPPNSMNGMRPQMMPGGPVGHLGGHPFGNMPGMMNRLSASGMNAGGPPGPMNPGVGGMGPQGSGKVYPPNQPMVFNPSNPNAPPIYPCGICHKEVHDNDQAILCESGCNFWFHRVCTGLTESAFLMLTKDVYAEWVCDKCLSSKNIPLVKMKP